MAELSLDQQRAVARARARIRIQQQSATPSVSSITGTANVGPTATSSFLKGTGDTVSMGFGDEAMAGLKTGFGLAGDYGAELENQRRGLREAQEAHPLAYGVGQVAGGLTGAAGLTRAGLSLAGRAINAGRGLRTVAPLSAVEGAGMGALYGAGSAREGERLAGAKQGALVGGAVGFAAPLATAAIGRAISPIRAPRSRQDAANILRQEGVDVTAGQRTGSNALRYMESEIGGAPAANMMERQGLQFTSAALRRAGVNADRATPDVIDGAFTRIGQQFDDLAARNRLVPDQQLRTDLRTSVQDYFGVTGASNRAPIVERVIRDIVDRAARHPNGIPGDYYQATRSALERAARGTSSPELANALRDIRAALDDAMERSLSAARSPDLGAWRNVRNQYRNMLILERAASGAGENAAVGIISPSALRNASVQVQGRRAYARGQSDLGELARAGEAVMKPLPNSGTAGRFGARNIGLGLASIIGSGVGGGAAGIPGAIAGTLAGAAAPFAAGRAIMSRPGQAWLGNQAANISPGARASLDSMLRGSLIPPAIPLLNGK